MLSLAYACLYPANLPYLLSPCLAGNSAGGRDRRQYNLPTSDEIAAVLPGDGLVDTDPRNIVIHRQDGTLFRITGDGQHTSTLHVLALPRFVRQGGAGLAGWHSTFRHSR